LGENWNGFIHSLEQHGKEWEEWYDGTAPEEAVIPGGFSAKLSKF
jgi:hypothetical protein